MGWSHTVLRRGLRVVFGMASKLRQIDGFLWETSGAAMALLASTLFVSCLLSTFLIKLDGVGYPDSCTHSQCEVRTYICNPEIFPEYPDSSPKPNLFQDSIQSKFAA